ncbi:MAG TPA: hypothetical protein VEI03_12710 [Stellaceae bacterium]|nr:hypothetical protein [Stellaceae bacterium]
MVEKVEHAAASDKLEGLSETFLGDVFRFYGVKASSLIVLSGMVVSGFGLKDTINPAIWLTAAVCAMLISYSLRHYVSSRYALVLLFSALIFLAVAGFIIFVGVRPLFPAALVTAPLFDQACAFAAFLFVATLFCVNFISYNRMLDAIPADQPPLVGQALRQFIFKNPFYYESMEYDVELIPADANTVQKVFSVKLVVRNRTSENRNFISRYHTPPGTFELLSAKVDGKLKDPNDRRIYSKDGVLLNDEVPARGSITIEVKMSEQIPREGNDIFTAYDCFAEQFRFSVTNHAEADLVAWIEPLHGQGTSAVREGKTASWSSNIAVLPYQGVRLHWIRREGNGT